MNTHHHWQALAIAMMLAVSTSSTLAQGHADHTDHTQHAAPATASTPAPAPSTATAPNHLLADGEVTRFNASTGKITLRHGDIRNLGMPPMTMVFSLKDPAQGAAFKPGDKVRFHAEDAGGTLVITHIERATP
ncbi:copper-binding protein [Diaphorobacter sp.]|uniref:copper-binding protein n=1 Tax=Diaphorobacter sp. TaxID=1934310 RepID=UPI0028A9026D|nr:copper-binding protein [Diaphorobacter sp.]